MYVPDHFAESRHEQLHGLIAAQPLGTLVTCSAHGIAANAIPFILMPGGDHGTLHGHVARSNAVWSTPQTVAEALVIFQGPEAYISPSWYASKRETHRVVPTWNYQVVHLYGPLVVHDDPKWVRAQAGRLTRQMEASSVVPWKMADAPRAYTDEQLGQIVGIEIPIARLLGKTKMSQNRSPADRAGAAAGLRETGEPVAAAVADLIDAAAGDGGEQVT